MTAGDSDMTIYNVEDCSKLPQTRKEAMALGEMFYYGGRVCKRGHTPSKRYAVDNSCFECKKNYRNSESTKANERSRYAKNPKTKRYAAKQYRKSNIEACKARDKKYRRDNPEKISARNAKRRAAKISAVPDYYATDKANIKEMLRIRNKLNQLSGTTYVIDHIWPLLPFSGNLRGVECIHNLQIISEADNLAKSNKQLELGGQKAKFNVRVINGVIRLPFIVNNDPNHKI